ncbi:helix-turn-helix domain-containing protein [Nostoc ellipsosporum NOK]|nr:helix-turn-helix domain-containing protein [Nostoc ellipsosporum NOK]
MTDKKEDDRLFDRVAAGVYLGGEENPLSPNTLAVWDCTKRHDLKPIKVGGRVRYRQSVLDQFLRDRQRP